MTVINRYSLTRPIYHNELDENTAHLYNHIGYWRSDFDYGAGTLTIEDGTVYRAKRPNVFAQPSQSPTFWQKYPLSENDFSSITHTHTELSQVTHNHPELANINHEHISNKHIQINLGDIHGLVVLDPGKGRYQRMDLFGIAVIGLIPGISGEWQELHLTVRAGPVAGTSQSQLYWVDPSPEVVTDSTSAPGISRGLPENPVGVGNGEYLFFEFTSLLGSTNWELDWKRAAI